ncbi:head maturation protease, ClpP-related [Comamonas antarctica]|uniref:head maturation protease, ClpP-related n=1 Tax=Comamonas antarctica TaxID=2743470 RepID=UPI0028E8EE47|nr:head maturation protease, ClpP-related [Comamonas antarctica]
MRPCFAFAARTATRPAVLAIDNEIGFWGTQAADFRTALAAVDGDELIVEINSPGGDVFAGLGMFNMLRTSGKAVTTRVTGVAASIASVLMLAGDKREMPANTLAMIHGVSSGVWGTIDEVAEHAETMRKIQSQVRQIYVDRMGVDEATADGYMAKDNWLTADECLEAGFATEIIDSVTATAKFDMARADLPEHVAKLFKAQQDEPQPDPTDVTDPPEPTDSPADVEKLAEPAAQVIAAMAESNGLKDYAKFFALNCASVADAQVRMAAAREVVALCTVVGAADKAAAHVRSGKPLAEVRAALVEAMAATDVHVETAPPEKPETNGKAAKPAAVNTDSIWASHNSQLKKGR